jgi:predicted TPR repeat methyltransferase
MLALAAKRGVYDLLDEAELTAWLTATPETFDLAVCADTLCYFGVLDEVLRGFERVLRPAGLLAFTLEKSPDGDTGPHRLQYNGRYSHSEPYVREALTAAGLRTLAIAPETLRLELGEPVAGLLVVAERSALA